MKTINGRESSVLCLLVQSNGLTEIDKVRILSVLQGQALKIAKVLTGNTKGASKQVKKAAAGFKTWVDGLGR